MYELVADIDRFNNCERAEFAYEPIWFICPLNEETAQGWQCFRLCEGLSKNLDAL